MTSTCPLPTFRLRQKEWFGDRGDNVYFKSKDGTEMIQFFDGGKFMSSQYFSKDMRKALGLPVDFPLELTLNANPKLPVPAIGHGDKRRSFDFSSLEIFITPTDSFKMKFRDVFTDTKLTHHSGKESHRWLNSPI